MEKCPICGQDDNCGDCNHQFSGRTEDREAYEKYIAS